MGLLRWTILAPDLCVVSDEVSLTLQFTFTLYLLPFHTGVTENAPQKTTYMQIFIFRFVPWGTQQQQQQKTNNNNKNIYFWLFFAIHLLVSYENLEDHIEDGRGQKERKLRAWRRATGFITNCYFELDVNKK